PHRLRYGQCRPLNCYYELSPRHLPFTLDLRQDLVDQINRDRKDNADIAAGLTEDSRVDANDFAAHVDQRSSRVSRVNGGISLDEIFIGPVTDMPALCANNSFSDSAIQTERVTDRRDPFTHLKAIGIP